MRILLAALTAISIGGSAAAASIDAEDMLKSFTVIALGKYELNSHTPGAVYACRDFKAANTINGGISNETVDDANGTLIVGGNITGGSMNVGGNVAVGGAIAPDAHINAHDDGTITEGANVPVGDVSASIHDLSDQLAQMPA